MDTETWNKIEESLQKYLETQNIPFKVTCDDWCTTSGNIWFDFEETFDYVDRGRARQRLYYALIRFSAFIYKQDDIWLRFSNECDHHENGSTLYVGYFY